MPQAEVIVTPLPLAEPCRVSIRFLDCARFNNSYDLYTVRIFLPTNEKAGTVDFHVSERDGKLYAIEKGLFVEEKYRRKGLATAMYSEFERVVGCTIVRDRSQTDLCKEFWNRPDRPWGNE